MPIVKSSFTPDELRVAFDLVTCASAFYEDEDARIRAITTAMKVLVDDHILLKSELSRDDGKHFKPDGSILVPCEKFPGRNSAASAFNEVKNGVGEGNSDPIHQAECDYQGDYILFYSAKDVIRAADLCAVFSGWSQV